MEKVNNLRAERDEALENARSMEELLGRFNLQLKNSGTLTACLEDEYARWSENVNVIATQITNLIGDVFISAAALS